MKTSKLFQTLSIFVVIGFTFQNAFAQETKRTTTEWLNVKGMNKQQIIETLQQALSDLKPSKPEEATERERSIKLKEQEDRYQFLQELLRLDANVSLKTLSHAQHEAAIQKAKTDLFVQKNQLGVYQQSMIRLRDRLSLIPFQVLVVAYANLENFESDPVVRRLAFEAGQEAIKHINGYHVIRQTLATKHFQTYDIILMNLAPYFSQVLSLSYISHSLSKVLHTSL